MKRGVGNLVGKSSFQKESHGKLYSISKKQLPMPNKKISVRGLPENLISSTNSYWKARACIKNTAGGEDGSWLDEFEQFARLHQIEYDKNNELLKKMNVFIEEYLNELRKSFKKLQSKSQLALDRKLKQFKEEWMSSHDGVSPEDIVLTGLESVELKTLKKEYEKMTKTIKREHSPIVHASPGSTNFEYLSNSIRLIASNRTICFCMDAEAFEFDTDVVTEIGISVYDPRENMYSSIPVTRNYHIIISEALTVRNTKYVCDSKDCYQMGESLVLSLNECVEFVQSLVNYYMIPKTVEDQSWSRAFVGHNVHGDITWLKQMGIHIPTVGDKVDNLDYQLQKTNNRAGGPTKEPIFVLDTEKLYRFTYGNKGGSLGKVLRLLRIPHAFLHNAGNDAYHTLQLLLRLCDINYRRQNGLDNLVEMYCKINQWVERERDEPKVLPMSYSLTAKLVDSPQSGREHHFNNKKKSKNLVHQTEFGGSQWFLTAREAFRSTLR